MLDDDRVFNMEFLLAASCYRPERARELVRDCREDILAFGWKAAMQKWSRFARRVEERQDMSLP